MRTHVALLRGINVGGRGRLPMSDLRDIVTSLGHTDVATYIQSGNVVLTAGGAPDGVEALAGALERKIAERSDVRPAVVVLTREGLRRVVAGNPYPEETDATHVHVTFVRGGTPPGSHDVVRGALEAARAKGSRDAATLAEGVLYLHTPDGFGHSVLAAELARPAATRALGAGSTTRNWATVTRLLAMLEE